MPTRTSSGYEKSRVDAHSNTLTLKGSLPENEIRSPIYLPTVETHIQTHANTSTSNSADTLVDIVLNFASCGIRFGRTCSIYVPRKEDTAETGDCRE